MIVAMGSALMLGVLVYALDMMLVLCGLPMLAAVMLVLLLPLAAIALAAPTGLGESEEPSEFGEPTVRGALPARVMRLIVFIAMLLFLLSLTRGYYPNLMDPGQFTASRCLVGLGLLAVGAAMAALAGVAPRNAAFGTLFYGLLICSVLVVLLLALLNVDATVMGDVSSVLYGMTML